jgi:hypothetical protein
LWSGIAEVLHLHVRAEAENLVAQLAVEAGHHADDDDEHGDAEHNAHHGDERDHGDERALGAQVTQGKKQLEWQPRHGPRG